MSFGTPSSESFLFSCTFRIETEAEVRDLSSEKYKKEEQERATKRSKERVRYQIGGRGKKRRIHRKVQKVQLREEQMCLVGYVAASMSA